MFKQQGAALVIVLSLLAGSLMIGISGMNAALIDERLAGNYRAAAQAQMAAEKGISQLDGTDLAIPFGDCQTLVENYSTLIGEDDWNVDGINGFNGGISARYLTCEKATGLNALLVQGRVEGTSAVSFVSKNFSSEVNIGDDGYLDGFFDWLGDSDNVTSFGGVETCDSSSFEDNKIYFCNDGESFKGDFDSDFNDVVFIVDGDISSNIKENIEGIFLVADGEVTFRVQGQNDFEGFIWSGGEITFNGVGKKSTISLDVCAEENPTVNGIDQGDINNACNKVEDFIERVNYDGQVEPGGTGYTQY